MEGASELKEKRNVMNEKFIIAAGKPNPRFTNANSTQPAHRIHQRQVESSK